MFQKLGFSKALPSRMFRLAPLAAPQVAVHVCRVGWNQKWLKLWQRTWRQYGWNHEFKSFVPLGMKLFCVFNQVEELWMN